MLKSIARTGVRCAENKRGMRFKLMLWVLMLFAAGVGCAHAQASDLVVSMILWSEAGKTRTEFFHPVYPQNGSNEPYQVRIKLDHPKADKDHTHQVHVRIFGDDGKAYVDCGGPVTVKAGDEWHRKDLKEVANLGGGDIFRSGSWPLGKYTVQVYVDGKPARYVQYAMVRPIDFPTDGRVYVKNLTGDGVRIVWGSGDPKPHIYLAANDAAFVTDKSGNPIIFSPTDLLTYRGRTVRVRDAAKWSEAKDGSCYWKLTIGGSEDP